MFRVSQVPTFLFHRAKQRGNKAVGREKKKTCKVMGFFKIREELQGIRGSPAGNHTCNRRSEVQQRANNNCGVHSGAVGGKKKSLHVPSSTGPKAGDRGGLGQILLMKKVLKEGAGAISRTAGIGEPQQSSVRLSRETRKWSPSIEKQSLTAVDVQSGKKRPRRKTLKTKKRDTSFVVLPVRSVEAGQQGGENSALHHKRNGPR